MQCNIDDRGKAIRLRLGLLTVAVAVGLGLVLLLTSVGGPWPWGITAALLVFGAIGIFEGRAGWCVVRAMGFRTPI